MADQDRDTLLMLGEMRGDIKYLVASTAAANDKQGQHELRIRALENFKTTIGVFTLVLSIVAPTLATTLMRKLGII